MRSFLSSVTTLKRFGALFALVGLLLAGSVLSADATDTTSHPQSVSSNDSLHPLQERWALPRNGTVQTLIAPRPSRPKDFGGFKDKIAERANVGREAVRISLASPTPPATAHVGHPPSWSWVSRAPPETPA